MALRDDDKVMAGLLRRTLASSPQSGTAPSADDCPPADILAAYYEHSLEAGESVRYELHFSRCALCREQLAAMARADEASPAQPKASWAWLWNPYWLAPALAVLALAIFFGVRHSARMTATAVTSAPANAPLVAMSRSDQAPQQEPAAPPPSAAAGTVRSNELKKAPSDSAARDSLAKEKQSQLRESPATSTGPLADSEPSALPSAPTGSEKKLQDAPLNKRDFIQLQSLRKSETVQKDAGAPQSFAQSAGAVAAGPPVQSAQNAPPSRQAPAPAPSVLGGVAGAGTAAADGSVTAESVNRNQTQAPAAMSRFAGIAKSPALQIAAETPAQKVFQTPNTNVLWRSADGGFVERSPDGGATWEGEPLPGTSGEIDAGSSPTPKICWLVGSGGTIFMTKDAANWKKITPPVQSDFSAVTAKDASNATVTAADGRQFQTTDGGKHWKAVP
jgi:hypothetical protein